MSDLGPIIPLTSGRSFGDKSPDELEALLDNLTTDGQLQDEVAPPPEATPEPEPEATPEPETEAEPEAAPEAEPEEPEIDLASHEREGDRIQIEKLRADLALQQAHASRLAGEIGYLKNQRSQPTSEPYEPQSQGEIDRLTQLEQRHAQMEAALNSARVSQAVQQSLASMDGPWVEDFKSEIEQLAPKYKDQLDLANSSSDPELARQLSTGIALAIKAEAREMRWEERHKTLVERKASTQAENSKAKKAVAASASGGVPAAPPRAKSFADLTPQEADAWLRENVR